MGGTAGAGRSSPMTSLRSAAAGQAVGALPLQASAPVTGIVYDIVCGHASSYVLQTSQQVQAAAPVCQWRHMRIRIATCQQPPAQHGCGAEGECVVANFWGTNFCFWRSSKLHATCSWAAGAKRPRHERAGKQLASAAACVIPAPHGFACASPVLPGPIAQPPCQPHAAEA